MLCKIILRTVNDSERRRNFAGRYVVWCHGTKSVSLCFYLTAHNLAATAIIIIMEFSGVYDISFKSVYSQAQSAEVGKDLHIYMYSISSQKAFRSHLHLGVLARSTTIR